MKIPNAKIFKVEIHFTVITNPTSLSSLSLDKKLKIELNIKYFLFFRHISRFKLSLLFETFPEKYKKMLVTHF